MTHPRYSHQHLQLKSIARLQQIYSDIGCTTTVRDRRCKDAWISAIADYQSAQLQKIAPDEQAIAQEELENFIADQAEAIAPEDLTTVEINRHHYEVYAGKRFIAYISYDNSEFVTQPWVVIVNGVEKFRYTTLTRCQRYINWHHKDETLNAPISGEIPEVPTISEICFYDHEALVNGELVASISFDSENHEDLYWRVMINGQEIFRDTTAARCQSYVKQQYQQGTLPVQEPFVEPDATDNAIMSQICNACEQYGLELVGDNGDIYHDNVKLGQVGCTNDQWWYVRASSEHQEKVPCDSATDALLLLQVGDTPISCEELLDLPFEQLTTVQWERLLEYQPEYRELVAA